MELRWKRITLWALALLINGYLWGSFLGPWGFLPAVLIAWGSGFFLGLNFFVRRK